MVYSRSNVLVYLWKGASQGVSMLDSPLDLEELLRFDAGKAFVGLHSDGYCAAFSLILRSFALQGFNTFNAEDPWNGLSVRYLCSFPVDLVFSPSVLEKYKNIFRLLFPLKAAQRSLSCAWNLLNRLWSATTRSPGLGDAAMFDELEHAHLKKQDLLYSRYACLRAKIGFTVDSLLSYFYLDVLEVKWAGLKEALPSLKEFEELRRLVSGYLESIYVQTFLNNPVVVEKIFSMIKLAKKFCLTVERLQQGEKIEDVFVEVKDCNKKFDATVAEFMRHLNNLNQASSSQFLSQLLTRLDFNEYYQTLANEQVENAVSIHIREGG